MNSHILHARLTSRCPAMRSMVLRLKRSVANSRLPEMVSASSFMCTMRSICTVLVIA